MDRPLDPMTAAGTRVYVTGVAACAGIAVSGSLHPFDFGWVPFTVAVARFWNGDLIGPPLWSATDVVSNFLLFVPIGLCAAAALEPNGPKRSGAMAVAFGVALSVGIEFGQAFVSWRTPSILDVLIEGLGTAAGATLWRVGRTEIDRMVITSTAPYRHASTGERLALIYVAAFSWFWLLPFDFTIRPWEIMDKHYHLRLLLPFSPSPDAASALELGIMTAAAVPIGMAGEGIERCRRGGGGVARGFLDGVGWLLALTFAQIFVFSRTTDATLIVAALPGVALGAAAGRFGFRAATGAAR